MKINLHSDARFPGLSALVAPFAGLIREFSKFGVVGLVALVVDVGLFNLLMFAGGSGPLVEKPLTPSLDEGRDRTRQGVIRGAVQCVSNEFDREEGVPT